MGRCPTGREFRFGIRSVTYQVPGSDNLALCVNGVPVMCKGGNWGMDEAMKRGGRPRLDAQIRLHQLANFNMIRNWVGQSTSEDFYDLCDQYGLLLWDEFFQPNPSDGPNPLDAVLYLANVREKVLRFRNHPSIVLWCARNEGNPPPVIDAGIRAIMTELDPQRLYQANSSAGRGVRSGGPYRWRPPEQYYIFPATEAFKTELGGGVSMPTLEAVHAMIPPKEWETINDDWAEHNFTRGTQGGERYAGDLAQRYGAWSSLPQFVREGQMANYEAFRAMYEGRQAKLFNPCTGVLDWMSNPAEPSFTYQLYSHDLEPNASLFAARKACEPVHLQMNQSDFHVMVINNTPGLLAGLQVRARLINFDGSIQSERRATVDARGCDAATDVFTMEFAAGLTPVHFVALELSDAGGRRISDNFYWHGADLTLLRSLATASVSAKITRHDRGGKCLLNVVLSNESAIPALLAHLQLRRGSTGERVLPVFYSDNYLSLLPGESRVIAIESDEIAPEAILLALDGWNIKETSWLSKN